MEHIKQFDWFFNARDDNFLTEQDIDNSCTERILHGTFYDPLMSSESEDETERKNINWDHVFNQKKAKQQKQHVPGMRQHPKYPKLSALNANQHFQLLKVLHSRDETSTKSSKFPNAGRMEYRVFEELKQTYETEQKEFIQWAKTLWSTGDNIRALTTKPQVEKVYEAELSMSLHEVQSLPKNYDMAGQIPLDNQKWSCDFALKDELVKLDTLDMPQIDFPDINDHKVAILKNVTMPEPCSRHPCRLVLPGEKEMTQSHKLEVNRTLAQYAADHQAQYVMSENSLHKLTEMNNSWTIPVTVCRVRGTNGASTNVAVLSSEVPTHKHGAKGRTRLAYKQMIHDNFTPYEEKLRVLNRWRQARNSKKIDKIVEKCQKDVNMDLSDDEDEVNLFIDVDEQESERRNSKEDIGNSKSMETDQSDIKEDTQTNNNDSDTCTCKDTEFERPIPRTFTKWQATCDKDADKYSTIVHCPHYVRGRDGELLLEPIPEYQLDLGVTELETDVIRRLVLSLMLRRNASAVLVRIDGQSGEVVHHERLTLEQLVLAHPDRVTEIRNTLYTVMSHLQGLLPGNYLLRHDPQHGANAVLWVSCAVGGTEALARDFARLPEADEANLLRKPPTIVPILLPIHKHRKILPCAFTPFPYLVSKEVKKPAAKQKIPPRAIKSGDGGATDNRRKWPKKKKHKKKPQPN